MKVCLCGQGGGTVDGAYQLAVIAAVDAIAEQWPKLQWDAAGQFYGEVRDAATPIDYIGLDYSASWATCNAGDAGIAAFGYGDIHGQRQVHQQFAEEKPTAGFMVEDQ